MNKEPITSDDLNRLRMRLYDADTAYQNTLESLRGLIGDNDKGDMTFEEYIHEKIPQLREMRDHVDNLSNQLIKTHEIIKKNKND